MNKILFLFISMSLFTCKSKDVNPEQYEQERIVFGEGGGFTGHINRYCILDNGMLFAKMHQDTGFIYKEKITENAGKQLVGNFETLGLHKINTNKPGNIYRFIELHGGKKDHKITWDPHNADNRDNLNKYYITLLQLFAIKNI